MPNAGASNELLARVLAGLVLGGIVVAAILIGGLFFVVIVIGFAVTGLWEWVQLTRQAEGTGWRIAGLGLAAMALVLVYFGALIGALGLVSCGLLVHHLWRRSLAETGWLCMGAVWQLAPAASLILLRSHESAGAALVALLLFSVWATDTAAYFGGRSIGGWKLCPVISPNKTVAGAISGLGAALAVGVIFSTLSSEMRPVTWIAAAAALSVGAQLGDLIESAVKRRFGVKDSGQMIPGHGGILDRTDGVSGAAILALLVSWMGHGGAMQNLFGTASP